MRDGTGWQKHLSPATTKGPASPAPLRHGLTRPILTPFKAYGSHPQVRSHSERL